MVSALTNKRKRFLQRFTSFILLTSLLIGAAGCSNNAQSSASQHKAKADSTESKVLRIGYVGSTKDNIPAGVEGWALQKKIYPARIEKNRYRKL